MGSTASWLVFAPLLSEGPDAQYCYAYEGNKLMASERTEDITMEDVQAGRRGDSTARAARASVDPALSLDNIVVGGDFTTHNITVALNRLATADPSKVQE